MKHSLELPSLPRACPELAEGEGPGEGLRQKKNHPMIQSLFPSDTPVLIQGITGKEGARMTAWLVKSGVNVVGGVTPGKAGQTVEDRPVFDTVLDAKNAFPHCTTTSIVVPASRVLGAVTEAIGAGMRFIHLLTEQIPVHDVIIMRKLAAESQVTLLGPSSIGYLQYPKFRLGYLGGESPFETITEGSTAVISTSGGMTNELMTSLARNGIGTRVAMALGGDRVIGTTLGDAVAFAEQLAEVKLIVCFVEPGRPFLKELLSSEHHLSKPLVLFLAGDALDTLPRGVAYGHTGTILGEGDASISETRDALRAHGIACVGTMSDCITEVKQFVTRDASL